MEGFGVGFMSFLDSVDKKAKMDLKKYKAPVIEEEYDFLKDEMEVALSEG